MIKEKIRETIDRYKLIEAGDSVILGLSGGPDSLCLFYILLELSSEMGFELHGAHVNHMFRGKEAHEDQLYVENLCEANGVCCWSTEIDCVELSKKLGLSGEEAGRKARYDFFAEITESLIFDGIERDRIKVAIAHNLNDQVETVIFRFLRGTGTDGLAGIDYNRINENGNRIIRPLLDVERRDIENYLEENYIEACEDHTNNQPVYTRNKIRLELIPKMEEDYNSNIVESISKLSRIAKEDSDYLWSEAEKEYEKSVSREEDNEVWLNVEKLRALSLAVRHRVILKAFGKIGLTIDISYTNLKQADDIIENGVTPQEISFPKGYAVRRSYDDIVCGLRSTDTGDLKPPKIIINTMDIENYEERRGLAVFDLDKLESEYNRSGLEKIIVIRKREKGDFIRIPGVSGRKKIQDLLVDMKVPKNIRDEVFMVAIGQEVLWIPEGKWKGRHSGNYRISESTKKVITVEVNSFL